MLPARLVHWGPSVAVAAGCAWLVAGLGSWLSPDGDDWDCNSSYDYVTNALGAAAFLVTAGAVLVLYLWQRKRAGKLGATGFVLVFAGSVAAGVNNPIEHCAGVSAMGYVVWLPATLSISVGMIILGIATIRAKVLPVWAGGSLILAMILAFVSAELLVLGGAWLVVGYSLWSVRGQPVLDSHLAT